MNDKNNEEAMNASSIVEIYNGHKIELRETSPRYWELWIDEKLYQNPIHRSRNEDELWIAGKTIVNGLPTDQKHQAIVRILEDFPYLKIFYFRNLFESELEGLYKDLHEDRRLNSFCIGSIVTIKGSSNTKGIILSFSNNRPTILWASGSKTTSKIAELNLHTIDPNTKIILNRPLLQPTEIESDILDELHRLNYSKCPNLGNDISVKQMPTVIVSNGSRSALCHAPRLLALLKKSDRSDLENGKIWEHIEQCTYFDNES